MPVALNVEKVLFGALHGTCGESTEPRASFAGAVDHSLVAIEVIALGIWMCARSLAWVRKKVTLTPTRTLPIRHTCPPQHLSDLGPSDCACWSARWISALPKPTNSLCAHQVGGRKR